MVPHRLLPTTPLLSSIVNASPLLSSTSRIYAVPSAAVAAAQQSREDCPYEGAQAVLLAATNGGGAGVVAAAETGAAGDGDAAATASSLLNPATSMSELVPMPIVSLTALVQIDEEALGLVAG